MSGLNQYRALLAKVDEKFREIHERNSSRMMCGRGCHACCVPGISVFRVEKENIKDHIESQPGLKERLLRLEQQDPHQGTRCRFLQEDGGCAIYEARPMVCRSHGAPLFSKAESELLLDVCPLNFSEIEDLTELENRDFMNLDTLNLILAALNRVLDPTGQRHPLQITELLKD